MKHYIALSVAGLFAALLLAPQSASAQIGTYGFLATLYMPVQNGSTAPPTKTCYKTRGNSVADGKAPNGCVAAGSVAPRFIGAAVPFLYVSAGLMVFDGAGHVLITDSASVDGTITRYETYTGTYTLNSNGTGSLILHSGTSGVPVNWEFVVVDGGNKLVLVGTDQGVSVTGFAIKQ